MVRLKSNVQVEGGGESWDGDGQGVGGLEN